MTDHNARYLGQCDRIFVDGTFRTAPHPYYQMVTIHDLFRTTIVPFCFALLTGKTVGHYRRIAAHVAGKVRAHHRRRSPPMAICDFEIVLVTPPSSESSDGDL